MNARNTYAPLLTADELSQINAERQEAADAAIVYLLRRQDGSEKLIASKPQGFDFVSDFGGGDVAGWATPAPPRPIPRAQRALLGLIDAGPGVADLVASIILVGMFALIVLTWGV
jgi:hypothetical protein